LSKGGKNCKTTMRMLTVGFSGSDIGVLGISLLVVGEGRSGRVGGAACLKHEEVDRGKTRIELNWMTKKRCVQRGSEICFISVGGKPKGELSSNKEEKGGRNKL